MAWSHHSKRFRHNNAHVHPRICTKTRSVLIRQCPENVPNDLRRKPESPCKTLRLVLRPELISGGPYAFAEGLRRWPGPSTSEQQRTHAVQRISQQLELGSLPSIPGAQ